MRTTLTLDPDVALQLKKEMKRRERPMKVVVNETLRNGFGGARRAGAGRAYRVKPLKLTLRPGIDPNRMNQLVDELSVEEFLRGQKR